MRHYLLLFLILLLPLSCKKGSDVLATTNAGDIRRSEFNDWLESRSISVESVYKDRYSMSDYLRQIAVEKITADRAEKNNYQNQSVYKTIENTLYKNHLSTFFIDQRSRETVFNEKGVDISIIRVFLKAKNSRDRSIEEEHKKGIIHNLLAELISGKDFNDLAVKFSEDAASSKKGHLGVVPESILDDEIKNAISTLNDNDYTKEPVMVGNSFCLIKLHKRYNINEKNIRNIVTDKDNAERIIDYYKNRSLDEIINRISREKSIVSKIDTASFIGRSEIIFSIDGESFTAGELDDILKLFYSLKYGIPSPEEFSLKEKKLTSGKIFKERLFASEAKRESIEENPVFKRNWFYLKRAALAGSFKYEILMKDLPVKDEEIRKEYLQNKTASYYKTKKINNKETKIYLSFNNVKTSIKNKLNREKLKTLKKQWDNEILSVGNYKIIDKEFLVD
jgi:hypothetical protein